MPQEFTIADLIEALRVYNQDDPVVVRFESYAVRGSINVSFNANTGNVELEVE